MISLYEKYFPILGLINTLFLVNREKMLEREREREKPLLYNILRNVRTHASRAEITKIFFSKQAPFARHSDRSIRSASEAIRCK